MAIPQGQAMGIQNAYSFKRSSKQRNWGRTLSPPPNLGLTEKIHQKVGEWMNPH